MSDTTMTKKNGDSNVTAHDRDAKGPESTLLPPVDVVEDPSGITLFADLPGVPKDKLSLQLETDSLTIEGDVTLDIPDGLQSSHVEVRQPRFRRSFTLSRDLDTAKASAEFKDGVLKLRIPKAAHRQPRRIEIQAS